MRYALIVAVLLGGSLVGGVLPASAQDCFQSMLAADVTDMENQLQLTGDQKTQVDAILQDGVTKRMAVITSLGIKCGEKPGFATLLKLQSQMDDLRTEQQTELAKILSEQQMFVVEAAAKQDETQFRTALLGSS